MFVYITTILKCKQSFNPKMESGMPYVKTVRS